MFQTATKTVKWVSIPVLLIASLFACCTAHYEPLVDYAICLGAVVLMLRAVWLKQYYWAAGLLAILAVFTPLSLVAKIFLLMSFTSIAAFTTLLTAFRPQPLAAD
ncbi:MAG: hypothetical protein ABSG65_06375 [Bryobacteraceae bacterium]|jgi:hypothetical protein